MPLPTEMISTPEYDYKKDTLEERLTQWNRFVQAIGIKKMSMQGDHMESIDLHSNFP